MSGSSIPTSERTSDTSLPKDKKRDDPTSDLEIKANPQPEPDSGIPEDDDAVTDTEQQPT